MNPEILPLQLRTRFIGGLAENVQTYFKQETDVEYPLEVINESLQMWLESRFDRMLEDLGQVITSPHMAESQKFRAILEQQLAAVSPVVRVPVQEAVPVQAQAPGTIFNGNRPFSPERLGAMIEYIARSGRDIYKTNLNKLLFYSDLTAYYLSGRGISGATYVNLPYGPVPEHVENVLGDLTQGGQIDMLPVEGMGESARMIKAADAESAHVLSAAEIETLDWVLDKYGDLSAGEISELSHTEKAYSNTRPGEPIAYEYGKFFKNLPGG